MKLVLSFIFILAALCGFSQEATTQPGILPVLYINVYESGTETFNDEIISANLDHKEYFKGVYWLETNGCSWIEDPEAENLGSRENPLPLQIKARGNYTRVAFAKKPFKIKLDSKQAMLGLSKSKHFALLAHADDSHGYLNNFTGFNLGKRIGLPWTPSVRPLELYINGDYRGLYFLTESVRVEKDRVNITELLDNEQNSDLVSGGYLVELDNYDEPEDIQLRITEKYCAGKWHNPYIRVSFKEPESYSDLQRAFITQQFNAINDGAETCDRDDVVWSYIDLDDAARYYLVREIMSDSESYIQSTYLFRDRGEGQKWHFSPLWDFGQSFTSTARTDLFVNHAKLGTTWLLSWMQNEKFMNKVRETWIWFMQNCYDGLEKDIDDFESSIAEAAKRDAARWKNVPLPSDSRAEPVCDNSDIESKAIFAKNFLNDKINWMKSIYGDYASLPKTDEPERDDTPAAMLPEFIQVSVYEMSDTSTGTGHEEYYTLQGLKTNSPRPGNLYIIVTPEGASKRIF